jgi:hypothetical protein
MGLDSQVNWLFGFQFNRLSSYSILSPPIIWLFSSQAIDYQSVQGSLYIRLASLDQILIFHSYKVLLRSFRDGHDVIQKVV